MRRIILLWMSCATVLMLSSCTISPVSEKYRHERMQASVEDAAKQYKAYFDKTHKVKSSMKIGVAMSDMNHETENRIYPLTFTYSQKGKKVRRDFELLVYRRSHLLKWHLSDPHEAFCRVDCFPEGTLKKHGVEEMKKHKLYADMTISYSSDSIQYILKKAPSAARKTKPQYVRVYAWEGNPLKQTDYAIGSLRRTAPIPLYEIQVRPVKSTCDIDVMVSGLVSNACIVARNVFGLWRIPVGLVFLVAVVYLFIVTADKLLKKQYVWPPVLSFFALVLMFFSFIILMGMASMLNFPSEFSDPFTGIAEVAFVVGCLLLIISLALYAFRRPLYIPIVILEVVLLFAGCCLTAPIWGVVAEIIKIVLMIMLLILIGTIIGSGTIVWGNNGGQSSGSLKPTDSASYKKGDTVYHNGRNYEHTGDWGDPFKPA